MIFRMNSKDHDRFDDELLETEKHSNRDKAERQDHKFTDPLPKFGWWFIVAGLVILFAGAMGASSLIELWARDYRDDMGILEKLFFTLILGVFSSLGILGGFGMVRTGFGRERTRKTK